MLGTAQRNAGKLDSTRATLEAAVVAATARRAAAAGAGPPRAVRLIGYDRTGTTRASPWVACTGAFLDAHPGDRLRTQLENNLGVLRDVAGRAAWRGRSAARATSDCRLGA